MLPSIAKIAELLGGDVSGSQVLCPGPGHDAGDRSLSVKPDKADSEGFVTHSFAGDDWKECRAHVRKKLGLPEFNKKDSGGKAWTVLAEHIYYDEHGERFLKVRKCRDGDGKKQYPQYHWDGNSWAKGKPEGPRIPYHLPQLIAAPTATIVHFVEGEKDCDNLAKLDFVATTASEGAAAKWDPALTQYFKDRHVVILPDADRPGRAHAQKVAKAINDVAASVRVLDLYPERHDGSDVSNWILDDTAGAKLAKLAKDAPLWEPGGTTDTVDRSEGAAPRPKTKLEKVDRSEGAALLTDASKFLARFVIYPSEHAQIAHVLWIAHAHLMDAWESTPRIAFLSPEPASGKTRSMEVTELLVPDPVAAVNVTPAYLFRKVGGEDGPPTILFDEIDTVFGAKAKEHEELRALLNSGHRRGAVAGRCVVRGATVETEEISSYSAVALAGLGWLPDTILSRSVIVRMRRRAPEEKIEAFRRRVHAPIGEGLRRRLAGWAATILDEATEARPEMPIGVDDRDADIWEPLLAVADIAGDEWAKRAREAAKALVAVAREVEPSLNIRLLADLRTVFGREEQMTTKQILADLCLLEDAPWNELKGKPLSDSQLARRLRQYGVKSKVIRVGTATPRGYVQEDLYDVWRRYLPPLTDKPATAATPQPFQGDSVAPQGFRTATDDANPQHAAAPRVAPVADDVEACCGSVDARKADEMGFVAHVADVAPFPGKGGDRAFEVVGRATLGSRCYLCGKGGEVYLVRRRGEREVDQAHLACAEKVWCAPQPPVTAAPTPANGRTDGSAAGLSQRTIADLAEDYTEAYRRRANGGADIDSAALDADLRRRLAEMALPEFVEVEFERVMAEVFRV